MKTICKYCNVEFISKNKLRRYCTPEHARQAKKDMQRMRTKRNPGLQKIYRRTYYLNNLEKCRTNAREYYYKKKDKRE